jgi:hypothetical protein
MVVGENIGSTGAQGFWKVQISEKKHAFKGQGVWSVSVKEKRKCERQRPSLSENNESQLRTFKALRL